MTADLRPQMDDLFATWHSPDGGTYLVREEPLLTAKVSSRALKLAGMARTLQAERAEWLQTALERLGRYARERAVPAFTAEQFRAFWLDSGRPEPHSHHVWGALFNRAAHEGLIRATGRYVKAKSAKTHSHPVAEWTAI
jgi:hypothetical protein